MAGGAVVETAAVYQCNNKHCTLGSRKSPGRFTGGMTAQQVNLLTAEPEESLTEGVDYGTGICPVCGEPGTLTDDVHDFKAGKTPKADTDASKDGDN